MSTQFSDPLHNCQFHHMRLESLDTYLLCFLDTSFCYSQHYGLFLDLKDVILFYKVFFVYISISLCKCAMFCFCLPIPSLYHVGMSTFPLFVTPYMQSARLASKDATPTGSFHKSRSESCVYVCAVIVWCVFLFCRWDNMASTLYK